MSDEMKNNQKSNKFNTFKKICFGLLILLPPITLVVVLHLGNWINSIYPNINLNPFGVDNVTWFGFWGGYLGGICTFIAFVFTVRSNEKNLERTIDVDRKNMVYQASVQNINAVRNLLSKNISEMNPMFIKAVFIRLQNMPKFNNVYDEQGISNLLVEIHSTQVTLGENYTRMQIETELANRTCEQCRNFEKCNMGNARCKFHKSYREIYENIHDALNNTASHVEASQQILKANKDISDYQKKCFELEMRKFEPNCSNELLAQIDINLKHYSEQIKEYQKIIDMDKNAETTNQVLCDVKTMNDVHINKIPNLIGLLKEYIYECKKNIYDELQGESKYCYVEDSEKAEKIKTEMETLQNRLNEELNIR